MFGFLLIGLMPVLGVLIAVQILRRAGNYAVMKPAREMLYVVLGQEEKYKAKNFIDTAVCRGGDAETVVGDLLKNTRNFQSASHAGQYGGWFRETADPEDAPADAEVSGFTID